MRYLVKRLCFDRKEAKIEELLDLNNLLSAKLDDHKSLREKISSMEETVSRFVKTVTQRYFNTVNVFARSDNEKHPKLSLIGVGVENVKLRNIQDDPPLYAAMLEMLYGCISSMHLVTDVTIVAHISVFVHSCLLSRYYENFVAKFIFSIPV